MSVTRTAVIKVKDSMTLSYSNATKQGSELPLLLDEIAPNIH